MLYRKYRPQTLDEVFGNKATLKSLDPLLDKEDPPHVYLFHGPSGTGKTTLARIVAKELGCEDHEIEEKNNASFRGIDSSREIIQNSRFKGMQCIIFDEAHQLTKDAQDALLKLFEDTPKNCFYILCTTEPTKVKKTIRTRCVEFETKPLSDQQMADLINYICKKEDKSIANASLDFIIKNSEGGSREALTILEQIIDLKEEAEEAALSSYKSAEVKAFDLCKAVGEKGDYFDAIKIFQSIKDDPEGVRRMVLAYYAKVLTGKQRDHARHVIECFSQNYFDTGRAGLGASIYDVFHDE